ncbi:MAG: BMP family ABC transporter substrate-binding protein [Candidatus Heimdallarchaeota archaeon]|nr:BMP family ABC transporter substrate-binding protein [Candidatus Heimdallarchaeota archaeon]
MSEATYGQSVLISTVVIAVIVGAGLGYGGSVAFSSDDDSGAGISGNLKAGFIYVGPITPIGWTGAHDIARVLLEEKYDWLETKAIESVVEGEAMSSIDALVDWGADVIFTTSFGFMDETITAGEKYPDVMFFHISGFKRSANVGTVFADFYQLYYLNGMMAGALTETDQLGYVGAFPIPELLRHINAFQMGARSVNSNVTTHVEWLFSWFNPTDATSKTSLLVNSKNVDVLAFTEDTDAVLLAAEDNDVLAFGHYSEMDSPALVSGQLVHWEIMYENILQKIITGEYTTKNLADVDPLGLLKEGAVELGGQFGVPIDPDYKTQLEAVMVTDPILGEISVYDLVLVRLAQMSEVNVGFDPYTGPLYSQDGTLKLKQDVRMTIFELMSIDYFIGVDGGCTAANDVGCVAGSASG